MVAAMARVRSREVVPEDTHVAPTRPLNRAKARQGAVPAAPRRSDPARVIRAALAGGTEKVWDARQAVVPSAMKLWRATANPWHLVGGSTTRTGAARAT